MGGRDRLDYAQLIQFTEEQLLGSNLAHSTVHGTGFGPISSWTTGRLQGPPLMVQVLAVTQTVQLHKLRMHKLKLSDGESVVNAVAFAPCSNCNLGLYYFQRGYNKVSQSHLHPGRRCM